MLSSEGVPRIAQKQKKRKYKIWASKANRAQKQNTKWQKKKKKRQENIHFFLSFFVCGGMSEKNFLSLIFSGIKKTQNMKRQKDYFTELFCFVFVCVFLYFWWVEWKNKKKKNDINTLECL
jgi:hypothetical protein